MIRLPVTVMLALGVIPDGQAAGQEPGGIAIVAGEFGTLGDRHKLDIVARLQQLCGPGAPSCSVFCSETSFGRYRVGHRPICRVTYRCPDAGTRATEAAKEELLMLRCEDVEVEAEGEGQPPVEQLQPPPYVPPQQGR